MASNFPILLIDDDPLLSDILTHASSSHFPEALFIQVFTCQQAQLYINSLDGNGPRLILLDLDLGNGASGLSLIGFLRAHLQARFLPLIILTVSDVPVLVFDAYQLGVSSFTVKPFDLPGWQGYLSQLRAYWFMTATLPRIFFQKD